MRRSERAPQEHEAKEDDEHEPEERGGRHGRDRVRGVGDELARRRTDVDRPAAPAGTAGHLSGNPAHPVAILDHARIIARDARGAPTVIEPTRFRVRRLTTPKLTALGTASIRGLLDAAFGSDEDERFTEADWLHAVGGVHFVLDLDDELVAHAAVVERKIHIGDRPLRAGYVEGVATAVDHQGRGAGSTLMTVVTTWIRERYELGVLGTGRHHFYERLGWETWHGPSYVRTPAGVRRTPDEDGYLLVLRTPTSPTFDLTEPISCEWREGDAW